MILLIISLVVMHGMSITGTSVIVGSWISIRKSNSIAEDKGLFFYLCVLSFFNSSWCICIAKWYLTFIQVLSEQYASIRRTRGDGNCFFRSFMFAYLVCYKFIVLQCRASIYVPISVVCPIRLLKDHLLTNEGAYFGSTRPKRSWTHKSQCGGMQKNTSKSGLCRIYIWRFFFGTHFILFDMLSRL